MSAAEALNVARAAGIRVGIDGGDLVLEAPAPPPVAVLNLLSQHKADIVLLLRPDNNGLSAKDWQVLYGKRAGHFEYDCGLSRRSAEAQAFEACVIEWLNRKPTPSSAGRCAWCGQVESRDAVVLPYGVEPGTHAWLHAECWGAWQQDRRAQAVDALALMGIGFSIADRSPAPSSSGR